MATANPVQLYERVSEEEALSRNARQYPYYPQPYPPMAPGYPQVPALVRASGPGPGCEQKCQWSFFEKRTICDWWCPRM